MKDNLCPYCLNAFVGNDLTPENDLSYLSVGKIAKPFSMFLRSGDEKPTVLVISHWDEKIKRNTDIGFYKMKYCPECGRRLNENE